MDTAAVDDARIGDDGAAAASPEVRWKSAVAYLPIMAMVPTVVPLLVTVNAAGSLRIMIDLNANMMPPEAPGALMNTQH